MFSIWRLKALKMKENKNFKTTRIHVGSRTQILKSQKFQILDRFKLFLDRFSDCFRIGSEMILGLRWAITLSDSEISIINFEIAQRNRSAELSAKCRRVLH